MVTSDICKISIDEQSAFLYKINEGEMGDKNLNWCFQSFFEFTTGVF